MKMYGYMGKILYVELTTRTIKEEELNPLFALQWIGDWSIGAKLIYDLLKPGIEPLSPENVIIIGAGPLAGTIVPGSGRTHVWSKWPVTNTIGPGGGPMGFSARLKYAGYDELIITGRADKPVYLKICDDSVEILDASDLWGTDIFEATDKMWNRHGPMNGVLCIGPAGENLVKTSLALIDKSGTIGRFGLGSVMGSKKLKLIVAGGKKGVSISNPIKVMELSDQMMREVMAWPIREEYIDIGHGAYDFDFLFPILGVTNYFTEQMDVSAGKDIFGPEVYMKRVKKSRLACPSCPVACRDIQQIKQGEYKGLISYSHTFSFSYGVHLQIKNIEDHVRLMDCSQRYGVDRIEATCGAEFLIDLNKRGIIKKEELEGIEIGNEKSFSKLIKKIAFKDGIGAVLADGLEGIVARFGEECRKYGDYIKGASCWLEPRSARLSTVLLDLVVNPYGPNQGKGGHFRPGKDKEASMDLYRRSLSEQLNIPPEALDRIFHDKALKVTTGRLLRYTQDCYAALSSLGMCLRRHLTQFYSMPRLAELYTAVTGIRIDAEELKRSGERAWNMFKALNVREGQRRDNDRFPQKWLEPLKSGDTEIPLMDQFGTKVLTEKDLDKMLDDYYNERGWELDTAIPTKSTLFDLDLNDVVKDLEESGIILK